MSQITIPKNHFCLNVTTEITVICEPLEMHNIKYFVFARCFDDGSIYFLTTNSDASYYHFQKEYSFNPGISSNILTTEFCCLASPKSSNASFNQAYYDYKNLFNIDYPLYFFERCNGYVDMFTFGSAVNDFKIINFYLNNMDILENFKLYFKEKANKLIQKSNKYKLMLPKHMQLNFGGITEVDEATNNINLLKNKIKDVNLRLKTHCNTQLTPREIQSLGFLLKGRTALETAQNLNISSKTVESYIDAVKTKLSCLSRAELFDKVQELNLINLIIKL